MPMDPNQAARDAVVPQIQGNSPDLVLDRRLIWAAVKAAGGSITVHPADLATWLPGTSELNADVDGVTGAVVLTAL